ncbi:MAG: PAS domain S-box protein [Acidobacteriota bacterium]|nr:PAS domain S-box protein [Acidobacteriota bacterium]
MHPLAFVPEPAADPRRTWSAQTASSQNAEYYRQLIEHAYDLITVVNAQGTIEFCSPSLTRVLGYRPEERVGRSFFELVHPHDLARSRQRFEQALDSRLPTPLVELQVLHRDGTWRTMESAGRVVSIDGEPRVIVNSRDVTDRKILEEQFRQAQKMEALGRLTGGIAHDFNNLLMIIQGNLQLHAEQLGGPPREELSEIAAAIESAVGLTTQLLAFSRRETTVMHPLDLHEVLRRQAPLVQRVCGRSVPLTLDLAPGPVHILSDDTRIAQVMLNLATNAGDAMPDGGTLAIRTRLLERATGVGGAVDGGIASYVCVEVSDTGHGISRADQARIFEPFFTTKPRGQGTGLGLSVVHGIVQQSGGHIEVESTPGAGTTFRLCFPLVDAAAAVAGGAA